MQIASASNNRRGMSFHIKAFIGFLAFHLVLMAAQHNRFTGTTSSGVLHPSGLASTTLRNLAREIATFSRQLLNSRLNY
jgi:hypothetical protein